RQHRHAPNLATGHGPGTRKSSLHTKLWKKCGNDAGGTPPHEYVGSQGARVANSNSGASMRNPLIQMQIRRQDTHNTFGMVRTNPNGSPRPHQGWDLFAPVGTEIYAITNGLIRDIRFMPNDAYGMQISLQFVRNG